MKALAALPAGGLLPEGTAAALEATLRDALERSDARAPRLVTASIPIARVDPIAVYRAFSGSSTPPTLWLQPSAGRAFVGVDEAIAFEVHGAAGLAQAGARWSELLARAALSRAGPVLLGGATFAPRPSADPVWRGFETGRLAVPRLLLGLHGDRTVLTGTVVADALASGDPVAGVRPLVEHLERTGAELARIASPQPLRVLRRVPDRAAWSISVARSAGAVGRGRIDKVVLARRVDLAGEEPLDVPFILRRLEETAPASTIFAIERPGGRTFLGATPERLVETQGRHFRTIALAGTRGRGRDADEDDRLGTDLLASEKDREEHQVVVTMLRETLRPLVDDLQIAARPHLVRHRTVQHLATEVAGTLRPGSNLLALAGALHPTPAVGGWPTDLALELLAEQEQLDRGWYAGPVGWLAADGDGEFAVAIRSGVVAGREASLFAGCGIVADSEPDREWEESELKLRALGAALGWIEG